jgi:hypothetical protein
MKGLLRGGSRLGFVAAGFLALFWVLSRMGSTGSKPPIGGFAVMAEAPGGWYMAPHVFFVAAIALWIIYGSAMRRVPSRESKGRSRLGKEFESSRRIKEQTGVGYLFRRSGWQVAGVTSSLIWVVVLATVIVDIRSWSGEPGVTIAPGAYVSIVIAAAGLLGSLVLIPGGAGQGVGTDDSEATHPRN